MSSSIDDNLFNEIRRLVPDGGTIVEFGSGDSTKRLAEFYKVVSFEENPEYLTEHSILAPIVDGWYDREIVRNNFPSNTDLVLIDGPAGTGNRYGYLHNCDLLYYVEHIIIHDTNRDAEKVMAGCLLRQLDRIFLEEKGDYTVI